MREKRDQHGGDVQCEVQAVARSLSGGIDHVHGGLLQMHFHFARGGRFIHLGHDDFRQHDGCWCGHDNRGKQVLDVDARNLYVGHHHSA